MTLFHVTLIYVINFPLFPNSVCTAAVRNFICCFLTIYETPHFTINMHRYKTKFSPQQKPRIELLKPEKKRLRNYAVYTLYFKPLQILVIEVSPRICEMANSSARD
jgi:hypothetical protein